MHKGTEQEDVLELDGPEELYERLSIKVDKGQEPLRLDKFLTARIENATRNKIQKGIEAGRVLVNSKQVQPNYKIKPADEIVVYSDKEAHGEEIVPEEMQLNIVFEDNDDQ
jgi:23S rRNA pseudouridine1911/1915/1917 synthase